MNIKSQDFITKASQHERLYSLDQDVHLKDTVNHPDDLTVRNNVQYKLRKHSHCPLSECRSNLQYKTSQHIFKIGKMSQTFLTPVETLWSL